MRCQKANIFSTDEDNNATVLITMKKGSCPFDFETTPMKAQDEVLMSQIWIFFLYFIWSVPNIMIGLIKFRDLDTIDKVIFVCEEKLMFWL